MRLVVRWLPVVDLVDEPLEPLHDELLVPLGHLDKVRDVVHHHLGARHRVVERQEGRLEVGEELLLRT